MDPEGQLHWVSPHHTRSEYDTPSEPSGSKIPKSRVVRILSRPEVDNRESLPGSYAATTITNAPMTRSTRSSDAHRPRFNMPSLHLEILRSPRPFFRLYYHLFQLSVFANIPLQTFFDFNVVFMIIQICKHPSSPSSGRSWTLAAAACIASAFINIFVVFLIYELVYTFVRRWRVKRPSIYGLYISSAAFNFTAIQSYDYFCFMQTLRLAAFGVGLDGRLEGHEGGKVDGDLRDGLAETCYFYSQNLPNVALLLPRAGIAVTLLLSYSALAPEDVIAGRDTTFFSTTGTLNGYSRGILFFTAAWTAWRTIILISSWLGLWILSERGCAGICGPRDRSEEYEYERNSAVSDGSYLGSQLPWDWRECTRRRVQDLYQFCLVTPKRRSKRMSTAPPTVVLDEEKHEKEPSDEDGEIDYPVTQVLSLNESAEHVPFPASTPAPAAMTVPYSTREEKRLTSSTLSTSMSSLGRPLSARFQTMSSSSGSHMYNRESVGSSVSPQSSRSPTSLASYHIPVTGTRSRSGSAPLPGPTMSGRPPGRPRARTRADSALESPRSSTESESEATSLLHHKRPVRPRPESATRPFSAFIASSRSNSPAHQRAYSISSSSVRSRIQSMRSRAQSLISASVSRQGSRANLKPQGDVVVDALTLKGELEEDSDEGSSVEESRNFTFGQRPPWIQDKKDVH